MSRNQEIVDACRRAYSGFEDGLIVEAQLYADTAKGRDSIDGLQVYPGGLLGPEPAQRAFAPRGIVRRRESFRGRA